jgi:hypothetical protein
MSNCPPFPRQLSSYCLALQVVLLTQFQKNLSLQVIHKQQIRAVTTIVGVVCFVLLWLSTSFSFAHLYSRLLKKRCVNKSSENFQSQFPKNTSNFHKFPSRFFRQSLCRYQLFLTALICTIALSHKIYYYIYIY